MVRRIEFLRVRTNSAGDAFTLPVDFETPFNTIPGLKYTIRMYTLINCPKLECIAAQDRISVQIKEGINGTFKEIYLVKDRSRDTRWIPDSINFHASDSILSVIYLFLIQFLSCLTKLRFVSSRSVGQGNGLGVGHFFVDQLEFRVYDRKCPIFYFMQYL